MEEYLASHLLRLSAAYCQSCGLNESTVGRLCAADGRFFPRIRDGKTFTIRKFDEVVQWFARQWPEDTDWPDGIPRPVIAPEAAE